MTIRTLNADDTRYPARLRERLGDDAPAQLSALGNLELLALPKTALFCSVRSPGHVILPAYDLAATWRDAGRCVIGSFHSPVEKECLNILLRGKQPIILCPARSLTGMRIPGAWQKAIEAGRMLILSSFPDAPRRVTTVFAARRNEFVAALADEVFIAHTAVGGKTERLQNRITEWGIPFVQDAIAK